MKKGDKIAVSIGGHEVAYAEIQFIGDGRAEMVIPATKVVMGVRTELEATPAPVPPTTETVITGVDRPGTETVDLPAEASVAANVAAGEAERAAQAPMTTLEQAVEPVAPVVNTPVPETPAPIIEAAGGQPEAAVKPSSEAPTQA